MYEIIKNIITYEPYNLQDIIKKINTIWIKNEITEEQKDELIRLANEKANPDNSSAEYSAQIKYLTEHVATLETTVADQGKQIQSIIDKLEEEGTIVPEPEPGPESKEFPEWSAWDGIQRPIPWQTGSKCIHNEKKWESLVNDNVWEPGAIGTETVWKEYSEAAVLI